MKEKLVGIVFFSVVLDVNVLTFQLKPQTSETFLTSEVYGSEAPKIGCG